MSPSVLATDLCNEKTFAMYTVVVYTVGVCCFKLFLWLRKGVSPLQCQSPFALTMDLCTASL